MVVCSIMLVFTEWHYIDCLYLLVASISNSHTSLVPHQRFLNIIHCNVAASLFNFYLVYSVFFSFL